MARPQDRPTAQQLAGYSAAQPALIGNRAANICPHCGGGMFVYKTMTGDSRTLRYEQCRACQKRYLTRQVHAEVIREID